jgi:CPA2 family monovalent cation:H+ antiporter-2
MEAAGHLDFSQVMVFLVAAGLVVPLARRFQVSQVLGFLLVGVAIGPHALGALAATYPALKPLLITDTKAVAYLAELGVVFLLFMIGLELSLARLMAMKRLVFGLGGAQVLVTGAAITGVALAFGNTLPTAMVIGGCLALSSTAIVMQVLTERGRIGSPVGRGGFAILLAQDLAVVPLLFMVTMLASGDRDNLLLDLGKALGLAVLVIAAILIIGRLVVGPLMRFVGATRSRELFMAAVLLVVISTAMGTSVAGLSLALGAFLAGLVFAETEFRHEIEVDLAPFKGLLLGLFFMSVGLGIDLTAVAREPMWILASAAGLMLFKAVILYALARAFRLANATAAEIALLLSQGGEFAFVILGLARGLGLIEDEIAQFMLIVTGATMMAAPVVAHLAERLGARLAVADTMDAGAQSTDAAAKPMANHVIIAGYGRVGRLLAEVLDRQQFDHIALDLDPIRVATCRKNGLPVFYGDASRMEILDHMHVARASAMVVTTDDAEAAERIVTTARAARPDLPILARARDGAHARRLLALGATEVVPETIEASLQLSDAVLRGIGFPAEAAHQVVDERREEENAALRVPPAL